LKMSEVKGRVRNCTLPRLSDVYELPLRLLRQMGSHGLPSA
jgi:hypothetical protein